MPDRIDVRRIANGYIVTVPRHGLPEERFCSHLTDVYMFLLRHFPSVTGRWVRPGERIEVMTKIGEDVVTEVKHG